MNVICRRARADDREALADLWREAFGDPCEEIARFLETFDHTKTAFVLCEDGRVRSMLFLLPTAVQDGERRYPAGYIYAGATQTDARSKGYYRRLLTFVADTAKQEGTAALLLRPATEELADSYRRMGFSVPLYGNSRLQKTNRVHTLTAKQYGACRRKRLGGQAYVDWDDRTLAYALSWCRADGDETSLTLFDGETVWESLPAAEQYETAWLMPIVENFQIRTPIWFGYGLE